MATYPDPLPPAPPRGWAPRRAAPSVQARRARMQPLAQRTDATQDMPRKAPTKHDADVPRLSAHPRARRQINAAKAWAGLGLFALVAYVSMQQGVPAFTAGVRALAAGTIGYVVAWAAALLVWRQIARNEVEELRARLIADRDRAREAADAAA
jgi:hypothetical protein